MQPETSRTYRPVLIESEHTSNKCDFINPEPLPRDSISIFSPFCVAKKV